MSSTYNPSTYMNAARPVIRTGRILYTNPSMGYYSIMPDAFTSGIDGVVHCIDNNIYDAVGNGISVAAMYPIGTTVQYVSKETTETPIPSSLVSIIGTDKTIPDNANSTAHIAWCLGGDPKSIKAENDIVLNAYIQVQGGILQLKDRAFGAPLDMSDGEYVLSGSLKNHLYIGYGVSALSGGYDNNLSFFTESNGCVFSTEGYYIHDTIEGREETYADPNGEAISLKQSSFNIAESFGVTDLQPFKRAEEAAGLYEDVAHKGQYPIYRLQETAGSIGQGYGLAVSSYNLQDAPKANITLPGEDILAEGILGANASAKASSLIQYGVSAIRTPWDGTVNISSLNSISIDKDYYIPYPVQLASEANITLTEKDLNKDKTPVALYSTLKGDISTYATQAASALYEYSKLLSIKRLFKSILKRVKSWKIFTFEETAKQLGIKEGKLPKLAPTEPCYSSKLTPMSDPIANNVSLIEALSAFIHVSPSGAIIITDGHGAEIRLEGGNITLSPAGDLKILPGRDMLSIIPGKQETVVKGRIDIASDTDIVTLKSETDVNILANTGSVILESSNTKPLTVVDESNWTGGGVIIKAASGVSMSGANISIRCQAYKDESKGRESIKNGFIVIDANEGSLVTYGKNIINRASDSMLSVGKASAISLSSALQLFGSSTVLPGNVVVGGESSVNLSIPAIDGKGMKAESLSIKAKKGGLIVSGSAVITDSFVAKSAMVSEMGILKCRISLGSVDNASILSGLKPPAQSSSLEFPYATLYSAQNAAAQAFSVTSNASSGITQSVVAMFNSQPIYQAKTLSTVSLSYPSTEDYNATNFFIVNSRWQRRLDSDTTWGEPNLVNDTMIFPGKEKWVDLDDCIRDVVAKGASKEYTYKDMFKDKLELSVSLDKAGALSTYKINI